MNNLIVAELVSRASLFKDLDAEGLAQVVQAAHTRAVSHSEFYFHQGNPATTLYVLLAGKARLLQLSPEGNEVLLGFVMPGEMFGGVSFLGQADYPLSAQAVEDCLAACWDGGTMSNLMEHFPRLALNAMRHMSARMQEMQARVRELSTERVERRIANTLLRLANQTGVKSPAGVLINVALTRQDIAEMTGTTLYTVSRTLSRWEQEGIIESRRERVIIRSPHGLVMIAEDLPPPGKNKNVKD